jgi:hypothetical protein
LRHPVLTMSVFFLCINTHLGKVYERHPFE